MAEFKGVKRSAERAAREALGSTLIDAAGKLGVALAAERAEQDRVAAARKRADELIEAARAEGAAIVAAAEAESAKSAASYRERWNESKIAGWRPAQLIAMGYPRPLAKNRPVTSESVTPDRDVGRTGCRPPTEDPLDEPVVVKPEAEDLGSLV